VNARRLLTALGAWRRGDQRTRNDRAQADRYARHRPTPERPEPGTDIDLYLDAALAYYGPAGLNRLSNAIHQTGEGDTQ
jgi:hypothetical protein